MPQRVDQTLYRVSSYQVPQRVDQTLYQVDQTLRPSARFDGGMAHRGSCAHPALFSTHNFFTDSVQPFLGGALLLLCTPPVALIIALSTLWGWLDDVLFRLLPLLSSLAHHPFFERFAARKGDGFFAPLAVWLCAVVPLLCLHEARHAALHGFSTWRALAYNLLRIGPTYGGFAWAYTLAHKEAHDAGGGGGGAFRGGRLGWVFNWLAGPFFGILPGTFTISHLLNHHRYHNSASDVYSTAGYRRDSLVSFSRYAVTWLFYACNVSTFYQLCIEGRTRAALQVAACTGAYLCLLGAVAWASPAWAAASLVWAFLESNILLAMVNWVWHCQISPSDPLNQWIISTTVVRGKNFILSEEYHAVHHLAAGLHFSKYKGMYEENATDYVKNKAIVFEDENLFVIWGRIVAGDYAGLARLVNDPQGVWDKAALPAELALRLGHCTW